MSRKGAEGSTHRITIQVSEAGGRRRVGFRGMDTMRVSDEILREENDEAIQRYPIEELDDGTQLGEIVIENGEYARTEWYDVP